MGVHCAEGDATYKSAPFDLDSGLRVACPREGGDGPGMTIGVLLLTVYILHTIFTPAAHLVHSHPFIVHTIEFTGTIPCQRLQKNFRYLAS